MIEKLYDIQKEFTQYVFKKKFNLTLEEIRQDKDLLIQWNKQYILALIKEATQVLDQLDWKMHVNKNENIITDNVLQQCIDVTKYILGLMILNGFTEQQIINKFISKSEKVKIKFDKNLKMEKENVEHD